MLGFIASVIFYRVSLPVASCESGSPPNLKNLFPTKNCFSLLFSPKAIGFSSIQQQPPPPSLRIVHPPSSQSPLYSISHSIVVKMGDSIKGEVDQGKKSIMGMRKFTLCPTSSYDRCQGAFEIDTAHQKQLQ